MPSSHGENVQALPKKAVDGLEDAKGADLFTPGKRTRWKPLPSIVIIADIEPPQHQPSMSTCRKNAD